MCHTDLHYREGGINDDFPFLLGHEAAGVVESVGEGVTDVAPGDFVILNWRAVCGDCRACRRGQPQYCFDTHNATQKMTLTDGTELSPALGIGAFAEKTLVAAGQCTKVDPAASRRRRRPARLRRDGRHRRRASTPAASTRGESVAVFGCGGVGDAAIAGARLAGASTIIAVDIDDRKLEWAKEFGATHVVQLEGRPTRSSPSGRSPAASAPTCASRRSATPRCTSRRSRPATSPAPWCRSACPNPEMTPRAAVHRVVRPRRGAQAVVVRRLPARRATSRCSSTCTCRAASTSTGSCRETIGLDGVEEAFHKMERGEVLRCVVVF